VLQDPTRRTQSPCWTSSLKADACATVLHRDLLRLRRGGVIEYMIMGHYRADGAVLQNLWPSSNEKLPWEGGKGVLSKGRV